MQVTRTDAGLANTADLADGAVQVGEKTYPFSVMLRLTNVQTDMQVCFVSELDEGHIPTTSEGTGVDIDKDCDSTVSKGTDVCFTISVETNYRLSRITLSVDGISRTVDADEDEITVDGIDYQLQQSEADVILYVDDVYAPIKVSAAASKLTTYDHSVTISPSARCRTVPYRPPAQVSIMAAR